jgi:elongator complex protein 2
MSFNGALHIWSKEDSKWKQLPTTTGHFGSVNDIAWDHTMQYLVSCSSDQTTRIFSECNEQWHEIARPQIHGYSINAIASLPYNRTDKQSAIKIVSAGDEKVIRLYNCPTNFIANIKAISNISIRRTVTEVLPTNLVEAQFKKEVETQPLGLMNKPISAKEGKDDENFFDPKFDPEKILANKDVSTEIGEQISTKVPTEEYLTNVSLWPEYNKLYGHAYEVLCSHPIEPWVASASKSQKQKYSTIFIWDIEKGIQIGKLGEHTLNVTSLSFSSDGKYLISTGRDRLLAVYKKSDSGSPYATVAKKEEAHTRAMTSCSWAPDSNHFITASRDKKAPIKLWSIENDVYSLLEID